MAKSASRRHRTADHVQCRLLLHREQLRLLGATGPQQLCARHTADLLSAGIRGLSFKRGARSSCQQHWIACSTACNNIAFRNCKYIEMTPFHKTKLRNNQAYSGVKQHSSTAKTSKHLGLRDLVIATAAVLSLLATLMTLAGFGVSLAMEQFGIAHETLFGSTLDLLDLSCWVVLFLFENINEISFWQEYLKLLPNLLPGVATGYLIILVGMALYYLRNRSFVRRWRKADWFKWWHPLSSSSFKIWVFNASLYCVFVWIVLPAIYIATASLLVLASAFLLTAPYMGFAAGNLQISRYVVSPEICEPLRSRASRLNDIRKTSKKPIYNANCVLVTSERGLSEQGRVVIATTTAILLYNPSSGRTVRIPTKNAIIESVDKI
jgi:hypothetical protein